MSVIPAFGKLRQEDCKFQDRLATCETLFQTNKTQPKIPYPHTNSTVLFLEERCLLLGNLVLKTQNKKLL
jgi:hypothetical protein